MLVPWLVIANMARAMATFLAVVAMALIPIMIIMPGPAIVVDQRSEREAGDQRCYEVVVVMRTGRRNRQRQQAGCGNDGKFVSDLCRH